MNSKDYIANYELNRYQYSEFWKDRGYEHKAEELLIRSLLGTYLPDLEKRSIMDVGGAFGRLTHLYSTAKEIILMDYSTRELLEGKELIDTVPYKEKVTFLAANAYRMPLKDASLDAVLCVRVMHHLKDTPLFFSELSRVLSSGGVAIIEFANKNHILSLVRQALKGNWTFSKQPITAVSHNSATSQGMEKGQESIMYNFAPAYVVNTAISAGLTVKGTFSCSFLRIPLLKKMIPESVLVSVESLLQRMFTHSLVTPSIFVVLQKNGLYTPKASTMQYQCPTCAASLVSKEGTMKCSAGHLFKQQTAPIIDLRDPRPESVTF